MSLGFIGVVAMVIGGALPWIMERFGSSLAEYRERMPTVRLYLVYGGIGFGLICTIISSILSPDEETGESLAQRREREERESEERRRNSINKPIIHGNEYRPRESGHTGIGT